MAYHAVSRLFVMVGAIALTANPGAAQSLDQIYRLAKAEGAFTYYVGGPTAPWDARARAFEQRYPGIKVSVTGGFSNVLDKRIDEQLAAGKLEVDAAMLQTLNDFVRWKSQGRLLNYKPPGFDMMDSSFKDPDGAFHTQQVVAMPYMYNTQLVKAADVPNSANDFLKPMFNGKNVTPYPADDDATLWLLYKVVEKYGWGWMDKYMATKPNFIQGHLGQQRSIVSGQNLVAIDSIFNITEPMKKSGSPVDSHFSTEDATPIWPLLAAVFKNAPHPNAGKLFMAWLLEPEQQTGMGTWSGRSDLPPPPGYQPIFSYKVVNDYLPFLLNETEVVELRKKFESYTGPVVNAGGVR